MKIPEPLVKIRDELADNHRHHARKLSPNENEIFCEGFNTAIEADRKYLLWDVAEFDQTFFEDEAKKRFVGPYNFDAHLDLREGFVDGAQCSHAQLAERIAAMKQGWDKINTSRANFIDQLHAANAEIKRLQICHKNWDSDVAARMDYFAQLQAANTRIKELETDLSNKKFWKGYYGFDRKPDSTNEGEK